MDGYKVYRIPVKVLRGTAVVVAKSDAEAYDLVTNEAEIEFDDVDDEYYLYPPLLEFDEYVQDDQWDLEEWTVMIARQQIEKKRKYLP